MEFFGAMFGLGVASIVVVATAAAAVASVALPILWVWMLIDSILRESYEYPGGGDNEKLVWVLLIALVQPVAILYFFMVYRKIARGAATHSQAPSVPVTPSAA